MHPFKGSEIGQEAKEATGKVGAGEKGKGKGLWSEPETVLVPLGSDGKDAVPPSQAGHSLSQGSGNKR